MVPQKLTKMVSKRDPKSEAKSLKWAPKALSKQGSKKKTKNDDVQHPHTPLDRALVWARARFSLFDKMCLWHPFGPHFGGVLGAQMKAKAIKKPSQKNTKKMIPKMTPNWSQRGSQNGAKIVKNDVLEASCFKGGSQEASRPPPGSILERFGTILGPFSSVFLTYFS